MMMKYFRFLYGETNACMIHFGEVKDTKRNEQVSFLFFRGSNEPMRQRELKTRMQNRPFLYPDSVDLAVLGNLKESVKQEWNKLGQCLKVKVLILPDVPEAEGLYLEHVDEVVRLQPDSPENESFMKGVHAKQWETVAAGWRFEVLCQKDGTLILWHDLAAVSSETASSEESETEEFIDCVMSVKATDNSECCENRNPDAYGCAVGCALRRDYDVCRFRYEKRADPYLTGTLLTAGAVKEEQKKEIPHWLAAKTDKIRFFSLQNPECWMDSLNGEWKTEHGMKRYFIGTNDEMSDYAAAEICRQGFYSTPVILKEGCGVCCSGFLKYAVGQEQEAR